MNTICDHEWVGVGFVLCTIPESSPQTCRKCGESRLYQESLADGSLSKLQCNICGSLMKMIKREHDTIFKCETIEKGKDCQIWTFSKDGNPGCTILAHLWPSGMKEDSDMYRNQYIPERRKELEFYSLAEFIAGYKTQEEYRNEMNKIDEMFKKWYEDHPEKPKRKSWFEKIFG